MLKQSSTRGLGTACSNRPPIYRGGEELVWPRRKLAPPVDHQSKEPPRGRGANCPNSRAGDAHGVAEVGGGGAVGVAFFSGFFRDHQPAPRPHKLLPAPTDWWEAAAGCSGPRRAELL